MLQLEHASRSAPSTSGSHKVESATTGSPVVKARRRGFLQRVAVAERSTGPAPVLIAVVGDVQLRPVGANQLRISSMIPTMSSGPRSWRGEQCMRCGKSPSWVGVDTCFPCGNAGRSGA